MYVGVSFQGAYIALMVEYLVFFNHDLGIGVCGFFGPRLRYVSKGLISCNIFTTTDAFMDMGVSEKGEHPSLRWEYFAMFFLV